MTEKPMTTRDNPALIDKLIDYVPDEEEEQFDTPEPERDEHGRIIRESFWE